VEQPLQAAVRQANPASLSVLTSSLEAKTCNKKNGYRVCPDLMVCPFFDAVYSGEPGGLAALQALISGVVEGSAFATWNVIWQDRLA
jgi:hypothetical protein